jgi:hypothetical protein
MMRQLSIAIATAVLLTASVGADVITDKDPYHYTAICAFFNLDDPSKVQDYQETTLETVEQWFRPDGTLFSLDEFVHGYWYELSYGKLDMHIDAFRDRDGRVLIPTLDIKNPQDWGLLAEMMVRLDPEGFWRQAGAIERDGKRIIENIVVMQNFRVGVSATVGIPARRFEIDGIKYEVNSMTHMPPRAPLNENLHGPSRYPGLWTTLVHEHAHNFIQGYDSYGGHGGKIGYWEVLGDNTPSGQMSETFSFYKVRHGWIKWKDVIEGPIFHTQTFRLKPYSETGEAIKIVPSPGRPGEAGKPDRPGLYPQQYFMLEYRCPKKEAKIWSPDGKCPEDGLLITHVDTRHGDWADWPNQWHPLFDIEEADGNDGKCWSPGEHGAYCDCRWNDPFQHDRVKGDLRAKLSKYPPNNWPNWDRPVGVCYPFTRPDGTVNDAFTPETDPNSDFYPDEFGQPYRTSGLYITNIHKEGDEMVFDVRITFAKDAPHEHLSWRDLGVPAVWPGVAR